MRHSGIGRCDGLGSPDRFDYHGMAGSLDPRDSLPPPGGADPPEGKV